MATRKKKQTVAMEMPGTLGGAKIILPEIKIVKESHLTITYDANNYPVKLEWDDEALLRDVRYAILSYESRIPVLETKKAKNARAKTN